MEEKEFSTGSLACVCVCFNREQSVVGNVTDRARRMWRTTSGDSSGGDFQMEGGSKAENRQG